MICLRGVFREYISSPSLAEDTTHDHPPVAVRRIGVVQAPKSF